MEIDVVYLSALIDDCNDPIVVLQRSNLSGERTNEQSARNTLKKHFENPLVYKPAFHTAHLLAMRYLGVDVPQDEEVSVLAKKMYPRAIR